jgi:hypothetical protein
MFNDACIVGDFRKCLWTGCASTATYYDNVFEKKDMDKSPLELMFKEKAKELKRLRKKCCSNQSLDPRKVE